MASSTEIPLVTLLPRAWIGFSRGPWRCVGLAALVLISASGPAVVGHDLRLSESPWLNRLGDLAVMASLVVPLLPLLALLRLTDGLLPDRRDDRPSRAGDSCCARPSPWCCLSWCWCWGRRIDSVVELGARTLEHGLGRPERAAGGVVLLSWLFSQTLALPLLVHERCRALQAMDHSRQLVHRNGLKVLALLGCCWPQSSGADRATLGLLLSLPFSALVLMACCRPQTPLSNDSRRNMFPT